MWSVPSAVKIFLCQEPTDMRKSFDALAVMVQQVIGQNPLCGHVFVFRNKPGNRLKLLYWDRDGYAIWYKRLEKGTFSVPPSDAGHRIDTRQLVMMLEGLQPKNMILKKRFQLK